ncbi:MAG: hypothetical protein HC888_14045 [Candidatus Competibacteraceae bacterium]|nr:hypothetical protein [Candidatus Competibacteraceae bacterium]
MVALALEAVLQEDRCAIVGPYSELDDAVAAATGEQLDAAVLDFDLGGQAVTPVIEVLTRRGVPFLILSGHVMVAESLLAAAPVSCASPSPRPSCTPRSTGSSPNRPAASRNSGIRRGPSIVSLRIINKVLGAGRRCRVVPRQRRNVSVPHSYRGPAVAEGDPERRAGSSFPRPCNRWKVPRRTARGWP